MNTWYHVEFYFIANEEPPTHTLEFLQWLKSSPIAYDDVRLERCTNGHAVGAVANRQVSVKESDC